MDLFFLEGSRFYKCVKSAIAAAGIMSAESLLIRPDLCCIFYACILEEFPGALG